MDTTFQKLEYNTTWGQYADIEDSAVPITKVIAKKKQETIIQINQIKKEETIQPYHDSNKLTKFQFCIIAIFIYLTCHVILII